jgi:hypothetical protein
MRAVGERPGYQRTADGCRLSEVPSEHRLQVCGPPSAYPFHSGARGQGPEISDQGSRIKDQGSAASVTCRDPCCLGPDLWGLSLRGPCRSGGGL